MGTRKGMEVSIGIAEAVMMADVDVIPAYPITPQTHIVEHLSELVADGHLDAEFVPVESEHSAMSCCCGSVAAGARTFTATSSQGLALMHEILFIASGMRLPMVMAVANRALSAPISIWNDHGDVMAARDTGWLQVFVENGQEAYDLMMWAFRVSEDHDVLLPIMVNFDGFILSHVVEPIEVWSPEEVKQFLPPYKPPYRLDVDKPWTFGAVGVPDIYLETRMAHNEALIGAQKVMEKAWDEMAEVVGRKYSVLENYKTDDSDIVFLTMGGISETCMTAVDQMRDEGKKVGVIRLRMWRPFPFAEVAKELGGRKVVLAVDRALSTGGCGGPVASEIKAALYPLDKRPQVVEFIAGLGGRDVTIGDFKEMYDKGVAVAAGGAVPPYEMVGVRA
jgi:pyruvate ferredoxin oxidoreductase alpha subunit